MPSRLIAQRVLWIAPQVIALMLVASMLRAKLVQRYGLFFAYTCLQLVRFVVLYPNYDDRLFYYFVYWAFEAFDVVVTIAIIHDIYIAVFNPYPALRRAGSALFHWAMAILIIVSVMAAAVAQGADSDRLTIGVTAFSQSAALVRGGLILLLVCLGLFFKLQWPHHAFGIAIGLGINLMLVAAAVTVRRHYGMPAQHAYALATQVAFNLGSLVWAKYFLLSERALQGVNPYARADLERWDAELAELMR
jgi:hypothetical protein